MIAMAEQEKVNYFKFPTMHTYISYLSSLIRRDYTAMMSVFLTCLSAYTDEPLNLFLKGESSTGKTYISTTVAKVFPPDDVWILAGLSPKALVHLKGHWEDEEGREIDMSNIPKKEDIEEYHEWKERMENARYVIELKNKTLIFLEAPAQEVFMVLRPLLSHDKFESEYKIVEKDKRGPYKTQTIVLRGWPATVFCTTNVKYIEELATRSFTVSPETTTDKIKGAIHRTAEEHSTINYKEKVEVEAKTLQPYISYVAAASSNFNVLIPFAEDVEKLFPGVRPREMRDVAHLFGMIKAVALFNFVRRPYVEVDGKKYLLATLDDLKFVLQIFSRIRETTELGLPEKVLIFFHEICENLKEFTISDCVATWNARHSLDKKSRDTIEKWLKALEEANLVSSEPDPADKRRVVWRALSRNSPEISRENPNRLISSLFPLSSFEKWLKSNIRNPNENTYYNNPISKQRIDEAKLYSILTKRICTSVRISDISSGHIFE
jgi:DNA-binding transcriptional ArsR family regulator